MSNVTRIHADKTGPRVNYIPEWAERFNLSQADIIEQIGVDKGTVSRWFNQKATPTPANLQKLTALFQMEDLTGVFRHPDDDWLTRMFKDKSEAEKARAIELLELHWKKIS